MNTSRSAEIPISPSYQVPLARAIKGAVKMPVIAVQQYGLGQVMFIGTDNTWRWRKNAGDFYYTAVWGQIAQRVSIQRLLGEVRDPVHRSQLLPTAVEVLMATHRRLPTVGGHLALSAPRRPVCKVLTVTGLDKTLLLTNSVDEAIDALVGSDTPHAAAD